MHDVGTIDPLVLLVEADLVNEVLLLALGKRRLFVKVADIP